jgi:hypothetical protein
MSVFTYEVTLPTGEITNGALKDCPSMNHALDILMHLEPEAEQVTVRRVERERYDALQAFRARNARH